MSLPHSQPEFAPLLDDIDAAPPAARRRSALEIIRARVGAILAADARISKKTGQALGASLAAAGILAGAAFAWSAFRPINAPDATDDPIDEVLTFALLDTDFSRLPVEERLRLALDLAKRMRAMSAGDSAIVAAFAAGIAGRARETLEANIRTLGMDLMSSYAEKYAKAPEGEKEQYLESAAVEWSKLAEELTGQARDITDEERLAEMKKQSTEEAERARATDRGLRPENVSSLFKMVQSDINRFASPNQRAGTQRFLRDMTRSLRGRDPATNQPKKN